MMCFIKVFQNIIGAIIGFIWGVGDLVYWIFKRVK